LVSFFKDSSDADTTEEAPKNRKRSKKPVTRNYSQSKFFDDDANKNHFTGMIGEGYTLKLNTFIPTGKKYVCIRKYTATSAGSGANVPFSCLKALKSCIDEIYLKRKDWCKFILLFTYSFPFVIERI